MAKDKIDLIHSERAKEKSIEALRKMKWLERKYKKNMLSHTMNNGMVISCNSAELLNENIEAYGKL